MINKSELLEVIHNDSQLRYDSLEEAYDDGRLHVTYGDHRTTLIDYLADVYGYDNLLLCDDLQLDKILQKYYQNHELTIHEKFNYNKVYQFAWIIFT